jgi:hypothetical protein
MQTRSMKLKERMLSGTALHQLPAELLGIIATHTENNGLKSMRATCRELRDGSASEFFRRYTSLKIRLSGSEEIDILYMEVETKTPDVAMAQAVTQSLMVPEASNSLDVSLRNGNPLRDRVPTHVARIYTDAAEIGDFELRQRTFTLPSEKPGVSALLLRRIVALVPQTLTLRDLDLSELEVDGDDLINVFEAHQHSLQYVDLREVVLTKAPECLEALGCIEARKIILENIKVRDDSGNLQYLTAESPALLRLERRLLQQDPEAFCYMTGSGERITHAFGFQRGGGI